MGELGLAGRGGTAWAAVAAAADAERSAVDPAGEERRRGSGGSGLPWAPSPAPPGGGQCGGKRPGGSRDPRGPDSSAVGRGAHSLPLQIPRGGRAEPASLLPRVLRGGGGQRGRGAGRHAFCSLSWAADRSLAACTCLSCAPDPLP